MLNGLKTRQFKNSNYNNLRDLKHSKLKTAQHNSYELKAPNLKNSNLTNSNSKHFAYINSDIYYLLSVTHEGSTMLLNWASVM